MNLLLLENHHLEGELARFEDPERVRHVRKILGLEVGDSLRVGLRGGPIGDGRIRAMTRQALELEIHLREPPPPRLDVDVVLALPRPKFLGRILQTVAAFGARSLSLVHSARVERSYWSSSVLAEGSVDRHLRLGLEQARDTVPPTVAAFRSFSAFREEALGRLLSGRRGLVADGEAEAPFPHRIEGPSTLFIGPEGGFVDSEVASLQAAGAQAGSLGPRAHRVETALAICLGRCL